MILGRFPTPALMSRPEAFGLAEKFGPIAAAIRKGNMVAFKHALGSQGGNQRWFFQMGILLQLLTRCEVLIWRSLARRVFLLTYKFPTDTSSRDAPTLDLMDVVGAAQYCQKVLEGWQRPPTTTAHTNTVFMRKPDLAPPPEHAKRLGPHEGVVFGNKMPTYLEIEAIVATLIQQGLLYGFISHGRGKFAIIGAKQKGVLNAGFPVVWEVLKERAEKEGRATVVPGWVQNEKSGRIGGVVRLRGARPVGSGG